jgi:hypothetical protein
MKLEEIKKALNLEDGESEEQVRTLRKKRGSLLSDIHNRQQILDKIDYILYKKEKMRRQK